MVIFRQTTKCNNVIIISERKTKFGGVFALKTDIQKLFMAFPWVETSTGPGGFMICVFII